MALTTTLLSATSSAHGLVIMRQPGGATVAAVAPIEEGEREWS